MSRAALGERAFLLLAAMALAPRWALRINSPWLFALEVPVLIALVVLTVRKIVEGRRLRHD